MKKYILLVLLLLAISLPKAALASEAVDEEIICPGAYGTGVVCGVKTHKPINAGIADNLMLLGAGFFAVSAASFSFYRKLSRAVA